MHDTYLLERIVTLLQVAATRKMSLCHPSNALIE